MAAAAADSDDDFSARLRGTEPSICVGCFGVASVVVVVVVAAAAAPIVEVVVFGDESVAVAGAAVPGGDVTAVVVVVVVLEASGGPASAGNGVVVIGATADALGRRVIGAAVRWATTMVGVWIAKGTNRPMGRLACGPLYGAKSVKLLENQRCSAGMRRGGGNEVFMAPPPPPLPNTPFPLAEW
jgi:hypothetical protein